MCRNLSWLLTHAHCTDRQTERLTEWILFHKHKLEKWIKFWHEPACPSYKLWNFLAWMPSLKLTEYLTWYFTRIISCRYMQTTELHTCYKDIYFPVTLECAQEFVLVINTCSPHWWQARTTGSFRKVTRKINFVNTMWCYCCFTSCIVLAPKKVTVTTMNNLHPVTLTSAVMKVCKTVVFM